ncbi:MAG TPA: hypothetical protein VG474_02245 [Solirubrobacteraceae bacterium]|nr:hypothetical protein [Solirubrobacteraceae bacterium]
MLSAIVASIWSDTFGLVFTFLIVMPALVIGLVIVAIVGARGEKEADEQVRGGRWGRRDRDLDS